MDQILCVLNTMVYTDDIPVAGTRAHNYREHLRLVIVLPWFFIHRILGSLRS